MTTKSGSSAGDRGREREAGNGNRRGVTGRDDGGNGAGRKAGPANPDTGPAGGDEEAATAAGGAPPPSRWGSARYRLLPRSVIGVSMLILAFAVGAGFSGVVLFSYYQYRQNQADNKVNALVNGYKSQFQKAESDLNAAAANARAQIEAQAKNVQSAIAGPSQLAALVKQVAPSVYFVHTLDSAGQPSVGTAFVISSNSSRSLLLTSYTTVTAATRAPSPALYVTQGDSTAQTPVTVSTWDPQYDMALLILPKGGLTALTVAPSTPAPQPGDRLFAVSGLGTAGASVAQGSVLDVSSEGLEMDAPIGTPFQGGPIVDSSGRVIAVGSRSYAPLGFTSDGTYFVPYVQSACAKVLSCPGGSLPTS